jgi:hypothetical protein
MAHKCMAGFTFQRFQVETVQEKKKLPNGIYFIMLSNETFRFLCKSSLR